TRSRSRSRS
ncbi:hypothetical protein ScalyP_jg11886, partial [Parmales sp. scaly parma]